MKIEAVLKALSYSLMALIVFMFVNFVVNGAENPIYISLSMNTTSGVIVGDTIELAAYRSDGGANRIVFFYYNSTLLGSAETNSSGYAVLYYVPGAGNYHFTAGITP